jgi:hypothetical protein
MDYQNINQNKSTKLENLNLKNGPIEVNNYL